MVRTCAISSDRVRSSEAMRSTLTIVVWAIRAFSVASRAAISASSTARVRSISRLRNCFAGGNLRLFGLGLAQRALTRHLGALQRPAHLDVAFLFEAGGLAL